MTRSRRRKVLRAKAGKCAGAALQGLSVASLMLAGSGLAMAQDGAAAKGLEEVIVTAQKRTENLQDVPLSVQALSTAKLEELNVSSFNDYVKFLPSVTFLTAGPGFSQITILPARAAAMAISWCRLFGTQMSTASMSLRATSFFQSVSIDL